MIGENMENNWKIEICRLCLAHTKVYAPLTQNEKVCLMLKALTGIEILPTEPSIICYKCQLNLNLAYKIQQNMLKAEEKFRTQFSVILIKEEIGPIKEESWVVTDDVTQDTTYIPEDFACNICNRTFNFRSDLHRHKYNHTKKNCPVCSKEINATALSKHLKGHTSRGEYTEKKVPTEFICDVCGHQFADKRKLKSHHRETHLNVNCEVCGIEIRRINWRRHMRSLHVKEFRDFENGENENIKTHKCELCSRTFTHRWELNIHTSKHKRASCGICGKDMLATSLAKHIETHSTPHTHKTEAEEPYTCSVCTKKFPNESSLKKHEFYHQRSTCPICSKDITTVNLQHHIKSHSDAYQQICELCGATLKNKHTLRKHMLLSHREAQHKCQFCSKPFKSKSIKNRHELKEHGGEANYVCDICGKKFYHSLHLKRHVDMKHLKLRPHVCEECNKSFSSDYALRTHRRIHTNETPYKCEVCAEGFRQKVSLKLHLKSKHQIEEELTHFCKVCGKGFGSAVALYSHQRVHE